MNDSALSTPDVIKPKIGHYHRHLLICTGSRCTADGQSQALYDSLGARPQSEWIRYRLTGDELHALAAQARPLDPQPCTPAP